MSDGTYMCETHAQWVAGDIAVSVDHRNIKNSYGADRDDELACSFDKLGQFFFAANSP